ncbi:hypothetical protein KFV02_05925 [Desulfohalobiaceae bacterium Ax17]|jgi:hypothetical protein|uniref:hypothetical protein n=1 Tax=Desulfovulcanus ferrireducens TaxID=2831190 RepID=UPI00207B99EB|nr:hypothetical protein [Desulfovulcanus ferrireducens]MBT8763467.1 hypothetical protein [Desulfovulcanus ferrireducens]
MKLKSLILIAATLLLFGCATLTKGPEPSSPEPETTPPPAPENTNSYYDFDDIPIPNEMKLDPKKSILFETPDMKAGAVVFKGRVDAVSLFNFFLANMPKENWNMRSYFKYGRYIMVFEKPNKDCIIRIIDHPITTELQIWVAPRFRQKLGHFSDSPENLEKNLSQ